jgi:tripartite-type tricarboxylate transporter receptor subunit TctC
LKLQRRNFLQLAAGAATAPIFARKASALDYPARPVRVLVGFPAGSASDILARVMAPFLSERLGQQFIVENRPGAATNIAAEAVVRAPPDGYTLLLITSTNSVNATLYQNLNFNFVTDIVPVASIDLVPYVMEVNLAVPAKTVPEFIAYAKANPGKINMASNGIGSGPHVAGELFKMMAGVNLVHVPYSGNVYPDLIGGQVQVMFSPIPASIGFVKSGQLRPLAVTTARRLAVLPDIPTVAEFLPGYDASGWHGIGAPKGTPAEIVDILNKNVSAGVADPDMKTRLAALGVEPMPATPAEFGKFVGRDIEKWAKVIKFADIKPE